MDGEENEQMCVGEDWVYFDVEKEYGGEEDEVLWPRFREKTALKKMTDTGEGGRQAAKRQPYKDLVPGFERMDKAGYGGCIPTGD